MKINLLFAALVLSVSTASAQSCVPADYNWGSALFGVSPDPTQGESFQVAEVGVPYHDIIYVRCPQFAGDVLGEDHPMYALAAGVPLDSIQLNSIELDNGITQIPLSDIGLTLTCNNNGESANACMFFPSNDYCGDIAGTPTVAGTWPVTINITAYLNLFGPQAIDYPLEGYTFTVSGETAVLNAPESTFAVSQNTPNPANTYTNITYSLMNQETVTIDITNLVGQRMKSVTMSGKIGENKALIDTSEMPDGIYLYSVQSGTKKVTKRMVIQH